MRKIIIFFCIFFLTLAISSKQSLAQAEDGENGFSLTPFFKEITVDSFRQEQSFVLELENKTDQVAVFKLLVLDFGALDESGGVAFLGSSKDLEKKYSLASWVSLEKDALALNPREKQGIKVSIINKDSLSPGGHYGAIVAKMDKEGENQGNSQIAFDPSFASLMFVRKMGGEIYELDLKEQKVKKSLFNIPSSISLRFQNSGNVHLIPRGTVKISDPFGREVARGIINSESALVLPETFRTMSVPIEKRALAFLPGRYEVSIDYRFDGKDDFANKKEKIDIVPSLAILAGLIIGGIIAGYAGLRKSNKGKRIKQEEKLSSGE